MSQLKSLTVLALAAAGLLAAGCSSSSSSSGSTPAATTPAASATTAATTPAATTPAATTPAPSSPAPSSPAVAAGPPSAADCKIIKSISASAIGNLIPLQTDSKAKGAAAMKTYVTSLQKADAKLTSVGGKAVLGGFITALEKSTTESTAHATATVTAALGSLGSACS